MKRLVPLFFILSACGGTPLQLNGVVLDHWGEPIEGATVQIEGKGSLTTDADGVFDLPGETAKYSMKAGKDGYIQDHQEFEITNLENPERPTFKLWKKPADKGFFVVGTADYQPIVSAPVEILGAGTSTVQGLKDVGKVRSEGTLQVIFHTDLKPHELAGFDLELHKLEFQKGTTVQSVEGPKEIEVNLYVSSGKVENFAYEPLRSKNDFLLSAEGIEPGYYALNSLHLLDMKDAEKFGQIPEALRLAYPFEVK